MPRSKGEVKLEFDRSPKVVGTGFMPLDVVMDQDTPHVQQLFAGGTCGNVLCILAYFGWNSIPIGRLKRDAAGTFVRRDMRRWGVRLDLLDLQPQTDTPVIVERIGRRSNGEPFHRFIWTCPSCGVWLPGYRPVVASEIPKVTSVVPNADVYFFDRVSRGAVDLAKWYAEKGSWVIFEPSGTADAKLFQEALKYAHVLKYSNERMNELSDLSGTDLPLLQIETIGEEGSRYRLSNNSRSNGRWHHVEPFPTNCLKDTAGAGDWLTAGLIHQLVELGSPSTARLTARNMLSMMKLGHALASWNCGFAGARGGMYNHSRETLALDIESIVTAKRLGRSARKNGHEGTLEVVCLSGSCKSVRGISLMHSQNRNVSQRHKRKSKS